MSQDPICTDKASSNLKRHGVILRRWPQWSTTCDWPTIWQPGFDDPHCMWCALNRFHTGQWPWLVPQMYTIGALRQMQMWDGTDSVTYSEWVPSDCALWWWFAKTSSCRWWHSLVGMVIKALVTWNHTINLRLYRWW